jgi:ABC-type multidrug transport system fused ATPase/permease subunit
VLNEAKKRLGAIQKKTAAVLFFLLLLSLIYKSTKVSLGIAIGGCLSILNIGVLGRIIDILFSQEKPSKAVIVRQYVIKLIVLFGTIYLLVTYHLVNIIAFIVGFSAFLFVLLLEGLFPPREPPTGN